VKRQCLCHTVPYFFWEHLLLCHLSRAACYTTLSGINRSSDMQRAGLTASEQCCHSCQASNTVWSQHQQLIGHLWAVLRSWTRRFMVMMFVWCHQETTGWCCC